MSVLSFDTLKYSKKLMEGGMAQQQAECQAEALAEVIHDQLATKQDIKDVRHEIQEVRQDMRNIKSETINELMVKLGAFIAISTAILGILISLHH